MINLGIVASGHKFADAGVGDGLSFTFNTQTYAESVTNPADDTDTLTISLTAGNEGDLAIFWDASSNFFTPVIPSEYVPTGWNSIGTGFNDASNEFRSNFSWRILTASDASSGSVTTGPAEVHSAYVLFFTPSEAITDLDHYDFTFEATTGDPALQTQNVTTLGAIAPVIGIGAKLAYSNIATHLLAEFTTDPFDDSFNNSTDGIQSGATGYKQGTRIGYVIQNSTVSDVSIDTADDGAAQKMMSFHLAPRQLSFVSADVRSTTSGNTSDTLSFASEDEGRLALLYLTRINTTSNDMPTALAPTGWTSVIDVQHDAGQEFRCQVFAKIIGASESNVVVTNGTEEMFACALERYSSPSDLSTITVRQTNFQNGFSFNPQNQLVTTAGGTAPRIIVGGMKVSFGTAASFIIPKWQTTAINQTPVDVSGAVALEFPITRFKFGYGSLVQNNTLSDVQVTTQNEGNMQTFLSFHLEVD